MSNSIFEFPANFSFIFISSKKRLPKLIQRQQNATGTRKMGSFKFVISTSKKYWVFCWFAKNFFQFNLPRMSVCPENISMKPMMTMNTIASSLAPVKKFCTLAAHEELMTLTNAMVRMTAIANSFKGHSPKLQSSRGRALTVNTFEIQLVTGQKQQVLVFRR